MLYVALSLFALALLNLLATVFFDANGLVVGLLGAFALVLFPALSVIWRQVREGRTRGAGQSGWRSQSANGTGYLSRFVPGRHGRFRRTAVMSLRMPVRLDLELEFRHENWFDLLCKRLGIAREFQTGAADFDAAVYISGEFDSLVAAALRREDVHDAITSLFGDGCTRVRLSRRWLQVDWEGFDADTRQAPGEYEVAAMAVIAAVLPAHSSRGLRVRGGWIGIALLWSASIALGGCLVLGLDFIAVRAFSLWMVVLPVALGLWLLLGSLAAWMLRGNSRGHVRWAALMAATALTAVLGAHGLVSHYNAVDDESAWVAREAVITDKWKRPRGRRSWSRSFIAVDDWAHPGRQVRFGIQRGAAVDAVRPGITRIRVDTRAGRFGIEWYSEYRLGID